MTQASHLEQLNLTPQITQVSCTGAMVTIHTGHRGQVGRGGHQVAAVLLLVLQLEPEAAEEARGCISLITGGTLSTSLARIILYMRQTRII